MAMIVLKHAGMYAMGSLFWITNELFYWKFTYSDATATKALANRMNPTQLQELLTAMKGFLPRNVKYTAECFRREGGSSSRKHGTSQSHIVHTHCMVCEVPFGYCEDKTEEFKPSHSVFTLYNEMVYEVADPSQKAALPILRNAWNERHKNCAACCILKEDFDNNSMPSEILCIFDESKVPYFVQNYYYIQLLLTWMGLSWVYL